MKTLAKLVAALLAPCAFGGCFLRTHASQSPVCDPRISVVHFHSYFDVLLTDMLVDKLRPAKYDTQLTVSPGRHTFSFSYEFEYSPQTSGLMREIAGKCTGSLRTRGGTEYEIDTTFDGPNPTVKVRDESSEVVVGTAICVNGHHKTSSASNQTR